MYTMSSGVAVFVTAVILLLGAPHVTRGSVEMTYHLDHFSSNGRDYNDECCDLFQIPCSCEARFTFCFDQYDGSNSLGECPFGVYRTGEHSGNSFDFHEYTLYDGQDNPITFTVFSWNMGIRMKVWVQDDDSGHSAHDTMDFYYENWEGEPDGWDEEPTIHKVAYYGVRESTERTTLIVDISARCSDHYYGVICDMHCPDDDYQPTSHTCESYVPSMGNQTGPGNMAGVIVNTDSGMGVSTLIIALVIGIFVALLVVIVSIALVYRYRRNIKQQSSNTSDHFENPIYDHPRPEVQDNVYDNTACSQNIQNMGAAGFSHQDQPNGSWDDLEQRARRKQREIEGNVTYDNPAKVDLSSSEAIYEIPENMRYHKK